MQPRTVTVRMIIGEVQTRMINDVPIAVKRLTYERITKYSAKR